MVNLSISKEFKAKWPNMKMACLECNIEVVAYQAELWERIKDESVKLQSSLKMEQISQQSAIAASRKGYRALGKDPARYRLSSEALMRRVLKGNDLYQINNVVDIVNLASFTSGFSIGAYDMATIEGSIELGIGCEGENYNGLGRGELNIDCLPVLRDSNSAFGSPTSDSPRTAVCENTKRLLMVYFGFGAHLQLTDELAKAKELLTAFAGADNFEQYFVE